MERRWLKEALFVGQTGNAFKLGTVLTLGWFWCRVCGCCVLYRGDSMETIDFDNALTVADFDVSEISPPSYVQHNSGSTYFYVVRKVNNCGYQEYTLAAAVKVVIDGDGQLAVGQPNSIFEVKADGVEGGKIQLSWFYCPLDQDSAVSCFRVYHDAGTGQIDYENPVATIGYLGRRFYSYRSGALEAGTYLFVIRAEDAGGMQDGSLASVAVQLDTTNPDAVEILSVEAV